MPLNLLPLGTLGAVETNGVVTFGIWLPWVSAADGNSVVVKIIHEHDQFLRSMPPREFALVHSMREPYGDFWSGTVPIAGTQPVCLGVGHAWALHLPLRDYKPERRDARLDYRPLRP